MATFRLPTPESITRIQDGAVLREVRERAGSLATPRQLRFLRATALAAGYDDAGLEARVRGEHGFGVETLDRKEASRLIDQFEYERLEKARNP